MFVFAAVESHHWVFYLMAANQLFCATSFVRMFRSDRACRNSAGT
jgi:hypothetical protein